MTDELAPGYVRLADYRPPDFRITDVDLLVDIGDGATTVTSTLTVVRAAPGVATPGIASLRLDGQSLDLVSVSVDGRELSGNEYRVDDESLTLFALPERATVRIVTRVRPEENSELSGLYRSGRMYCTQCEAEGFRRITYYLDRPDVLARFTTTIVADRDRCPVLLSNGNLVATATVGSDRHQATWHDPFPKPAYLFALVAGDLALVTDEFVTTSGRRVELRIYSEPHNIAKCGYAMDSLKRAMRWDEQVYGREYDLDVFMIVAVEDFNMGAMENKGLNIFNTSCVLATPDAATDAAYRRVEGVVAHEYFHNWSGNRVTCRDWFQLSLKEGFTVFRDAQFSGDMFSPTVKRIESVEFLRTFQFPEDAGPLAHPVRPDSYLEISNFYTTTIYEKGAEVVRMIHTILGPDRFRKGTDLYFDRHDGQAVTTEDFIVAMEDANGVDLGRFRRWYDQAGTPVLAVAQRFEAGTLTLTFEQSCPPTPGQPHKEPFHLPVAIGLLDAEGRELLGAAAVARGVDLAVASDARVENPQRDGTLVVHVEAPTATVSVTGLTRAPVPSVLRGFSAPVRVQFERSTEELAFLVLRDTDGFCRWDAMRTLQCDAIHGFSTGSSSVAVIVSLYGTLLEQAVREHSVEVRALLAEMLTLPSETYLGDGMTEVDVDGIHQARGALIARLGGEHLNAWRRLYACRPAGPFDAGPAAMADRALANLALGFLAAASTATGTVHEARGRLLAQYEEADNLTDRLAALREVLAATWLGDAERERLVTSFYERWREEKLVVDQWFTLQAAAPTQGALERVVRLEDHEAFDRRNPNRARALYGAFANQNLVAFHALDGRGYAFLAERVAAIDAQNAQLAARLLIPLTRFRRFGRERQRLMRDALLRLRGARSKDVRELVEKSLAG
jgi:aminopeptidase N